MVVGHPLTPHTTSSLRGPRPVPLPPQSLPPPPPLPPLHPPSPFLRVRARPATVAGHFRPRDLSLSLSRLHWAVEVKTWRDPARSLKVAATSFPVFSFLLHYHNYHHHRHKSWAFSTNICVFFPSLLLSQPLLPPSPPLPRNGSSLSPYFCHPFSLAFTVLRAWAASCDEGPVSACGSQKHKVGRKGERRAGEGGGESGGKGGKRKKKEKKERKKKEKKKKDPRSRAGDRLKGVK